MRTTKIPHLCRGAELVHDNEAPEPFMVFVGMEIIGSGSTRREAMASARSALRGPRPVVPECMQ